MQIESTSEKLFFTTTKISAYHSPGTPTYSVGTGFFLKLNPDLLHGETFVVTNRHMVENFSAWSLSFFSSINDKLILTKCVNSAPRSYRWYCHPNKEIDIAVALIKPFLDIKNFSPSFRDCIFLKSISQSDIISVNEENKLDAIEDVIFIGYPNGMWDEVNHLPIARKGMTASPLSIDFNGIPQFLVDASMFQGSSGSPVFLRDSGVRASKDGTSFGLGIPLFYFLGVVASGKFTHNKVQPEKYGLSSIEMMDIGCVFKARTIIETIEYFKSSISDEIELYKDPS